MVMEMSFGSSFSFLPWGLEGGFSIGLEDHLAFIPFTHINIYLQTGVEEFYYRNFSCFSTADLPVAWLLLTGERLEVSVDMLEVSSEGKNVFAVPAKYMIRLSESVSEAPCLAVLTPLRLCPWRLLLPRLCVFVLRLHVGFLPPPASPKEVLLSGGHRKAPDVDLVLISSSVKFHSLGWVGGKQAKGRSKWNQKDLLHFPL